jgi:Zn-dependent peptidase ImmA (M78 family)/transcriptional regulator with XRE-family HTH domain
MHPDFNPYAVTIARRAKGFSQAELADLVGVSQAAVSHWEKGSRVPETTDLVERIASALDVLPLTLVDNSTATTRPMFRASGVKKKGDEYRIEGRTELARQAASRILNAVDIEPGISWPSVDDPLGLDPEEAAATLRRVWRIPAGPIPNLTQFVESAGAVVLCVDFGHPKVEAAYAHPRRDARRWILINTYVTDWARSRLTLAHELGHAMLHHWDAFSVPDERHREAQAYSFALALMVPASDFTRDVVHTKRRWEDFLHLRQKWGISAAALARRARDLSLLSDAAYRSLNIRRQSLGHRTLEPGDDARPERPTVFPEAISLLRGDAHWTDQSFSEVAGLPYPRLTDLLPDDFPTDTEPSRVKLRRVK